MPSHIYLAIDGIRVKFGNDKIMNKIGIDEYRSLLANGRLTVASGSLNTPEHYASIAHGLVWRFPWPDEQGQTVGVIQSRLVLRSQTLAIEGIQVGHLSVEATIVNKWGTHAIMLVACPHTERGRELAIEAPQLQRAQILGEAFTAGSRATLLACEFCETLFYLTPSELALAREQNTDKPEICALLRAADSQVKP